MYLYFKRVIYHYQHDFRGLNFYRCNYVTIIFRLKCLRTLFCQSTGLQSPKLIKVGRKNMTGIKLLRFSKW